MSSEIWQWIFVWKNLFNDEFSLRALILVKRPRGLLKCFTHYLSSRASHEFKHHLDLGSIQPSWIIQENTIFTIVYSQVPIQLSEMEQY